MLPHHLKQCKKTRLQTTDQDYQPPYHYQNVLNNKNQSKQPEMNHLEKEQIAGLLFENKIKRYPLRNYVNLSTGTNIQCRPNYYESGPETSVIRRRKAYKRRHSISVPSDEEKHEERPNQCQKIRPRRYSDGFPHFSLYNTEEEENTLEEAKNSTQISSKDPCCAIITRVFTYTSKKGVVKLVQTEQLNEELPQNSVLKTLMKVDHSVLGKRLQLENGSGDTPVPNGGPYSTNNLTNGGELSRTNSLLPFTAHKENVQSEIGKCLDNELQENSYLSEQTNFLSRCSLKRHEQNNLDQIEVETNTKAEETQTKSRSSLEIDTSNDFVSNSTFENDAVKVNKVQTNLKSHDAVQGTSEKLDEKSFSTVGKVKSKAKVQKVQLKSKNLVPVKKKKPLQELLQEHRENLFKPDMILRKDTVLVKILNEDPKVSNSGDVIEENMNKTNTDKDKYTKHQDKVKKINNVQIPVENITSQPKTVPLNTSDSKKTVYDIDDIERKLKQIFGEDNDDVTESAISANAVQNKHTDKSPKHCVLCKKKTKWAKKTNQELAELKKRENLSKDKALSGPKSVDVGNIMEEIKALRKKRNELKKIQILLESILCSKETCIRQINSTTKKIKEKSTKEAARTQQHQNITLDGEKRAEKSVQQQGLVRKGLDSTKRKSNPQNSNKPRPLKLVKEKKQPLRKRINPNQIPNLPKERLAVENVTSGTIMKEPHQQNLIHQSYMSPEQLLCENVAYEVVIKDQSNEESTLQDSVLENQSNVENVPLQQEGQFQHLEQPSNTIVTTAIIERQPVVDETDDWLFSEQTTVENVPQNLLTEEQTLVGLTQCDSTGDTNNQKSIRGQNVKEQFQPNLLEQTSVDSCQQDSVRDYLDEEQNMEETTRILKDIITNEGTRKEQSIEEPEDFQSISNEQFLCCLDILNESIEEDTESIQGVSIDNLMLEQQNNENSDLITRKEQSQLKSREQSSTCLNIFNKSVVEEQITKESNQQDSMTNIIIEHQNIEDSNLIRKANIIRKSTREQSQLKSKEQFSTGLNIANKSVIEEQTIMESNQQDSVNNIIIEHQNIKDSSLIKKANIVRKSTREQSQPKSKEQFSTCLNKANKSVIEEQTIIESNQQDSMNNFITEEQNIEDSSMINGVNVTLESTREQSQPKSIEQFSTCLNKVIRSIIEEQTMLEDQNFDDSTLIHKVNVVRKSARAEQSQPKSRKQCSNCLNRVGEEQTMKEPNQQESMNNMTLVDQNIVDSSKVNVILEYTREQSQPKSREPLSTCLNVLKSSIGEQRPTKSNQRYVINNLMTEQQIVKDSTQFNSHDSTRERSQSNSREQSSSYQNIPNKTFVGEQRMIESLQDSTNNSVTKETTQLKDNSNSNEIVPQESTTTSSQYNQSNPENICCDSTTEDLKEKEEKHNLLTYLESCCSPSTMTQCSENEIKPKPEEDCDDTLPSKLEELLPTDKIEKLSPKHSCGSLDESDLKQDTECCCCLKKEEKLSESNELLNIDLTTEKHENDSTELETNITISDEDEDVKIVFSSLPKKRKRNCLNPKCKNCSSAKNLRRKRVQLETGVIILDDELEPVSVSKKNPNNLTLPNIIVLDEDDSPTTTLVDKNIEELPSVSTNPTDGGPTPENTTETEGIDSSVAARLTQDDVIVRMTEMEHYKKRLIHQHEKPDTISPPSTTTEEEDDSLESPLSPASNGQPRETGQRERRKDEVVQKVTRKRAVCRSQFRHQNLEIFKLGKSIPTSLCKSKEPYNVCTEKNLQMCYQNGSVKKTDKPSSKGLTESIINTMEGGKRREVPLWRSTSLNNEQNSVSNSTGRHILPAIVPELPERRKGRAKSLQENNGKNSREDFETRSECSAESVDLRERPITEKASLTENRTEDSGSMMENITEAHCQNVAGRRQEASDYAPMNLSMKRRDSQSWEESLHSRQAKMKEVNSNQHLSSVIPKQPSNIPKKPVLQDVSEQNVSNLEGTRVDKDGNCYFLTAIPTEALDPQKKSNFIVINFPHIQQQMSRMETPVPVVEVPHSPLEVLDSAIMSLINIVRSSVETAFNPMSLPVLNRLYVDLNRYLLLPTVSVKMKMCIEDALNTLIVYLLMNWFHAPQTPKTRDFVHRLLQLDLRPHVEFLSRSSEMIRRQIKDDDFRDHLLQILSRRPPEVFPQQRQFFPGQPQQGSVEFRDVAPGRFWGDNVGYPRGNVAVAHANFVGNPVQAPQQQRGRRHSGKPEQSLMRGPESFNGHNLAVARPNLHQPDNRCIPPQIPHHPDTVLMNAPNQVPPKGRPRNPPPPRMTKPPIHPSDNVFGLPTLPQVPVPIAPPIENQPPNRWTKPPENLPGTTHASPLIAIRRNTDILPPKNVPEDTSPLIKKLRLMNERQTVQEVPQSDVTANVVPVSHRPYLPIPSENHAKISHGKVYKPPEKPSKIVPEPKMIATVAKDALNSNRETVLKHCADSDIEQFLQTNIIVNNHQNSSVIRGSVPENSNTPKKVDDKLDNATSDGELVNLSKKPVPSDQTVSETVTSVDKHSTSDCVENSLKETKTNETTSVNKVSESVSSTSTVIIKDKTMEISKSDTSFSSDTSSSIKNSTDLDDVVLERVSSNAEVKDGVSHTLGPKKSEKQSDGDKGIVGETQKSLLEEDVSIEKVTDSIREVLPKLTKLSTLKRKIIQDDKQSKKKVKWRQPQGELLSDDIVIIEDDDKETTTDVNQNDVTKIEINTEKPNGDARPVIEDISDDETLEPFRLYSTYETKVNGDPRKILQTTEVSHCTLIEGSVEAVQKANPELFEKPPVYTRPVMPRKLREECEAPPKRKLLADIVQFREEPDSMTCSLNIRNTSDVARFSPNFNSTPLTGVVQTSPSVPHSPLSSPIIQTRLMTGAKCTVTLPEGQRAAPPPLDESRMNWRHWFADEQRKGIFNFERSHSTESARSTEATGSDYGSNFSPDESFFEVEIDSKMHRIRKKLYDRIPKGKLCYVRESNTFIRYFDDNQMELFIRNLSAGEKSPVAENLIRQVRGTSDAVSPTETSGKGEVIRLSRDVSFSSEDYLSVPELYVEEVEKVQRYVPKDFYGFYMYVTGYQIVNRHFPISFQTFLAMHNTNGIKVLFRNYVNSLIEGKNVT